MPALFPIIAIIAVFVFISAHGVTHPQQKHSSQAYQNQEFTSLKDISQALLRDLKALRTITILALHLDREEGKATREISSKENNEDSIVEVFELSINKQIIRLLIVYALLVAINWFNSAVINWWVLALPIVPIGTFVGIRLLTRYRIFKEYYGNNRYEALELLRFIEENSSNSDFPGGPGKKVFLSHRARKERSFKRMEGIGDVV